MRPRLLLFYLTLLWPALAWAHLGSPDVFFNGMVGPWPASITIRMPSVVPGRAEIIVRAESEVPLAVSFVPIASKTAVSNAPPPELAAPVRGETNLYSGELWLMTSGAYSILVRIRGPSGDAAVQIPVNSIATAQLPLPPLLGQTLLALGLILFCGGMAIVAAAAGESALPPGAAPGKTDRRKYWIAASITGLILALGLVGGKKWWNSDEQDFRTRLIEGGWPDLTAAARVEGSQRVLSLTLGKPSLSAHGLPARLDLAPDHGKLIHLFVVGQPNHQTFAHLHPVRSGDASFEVALPPLPEGDYELFCDLTFGSGFSSTATNTIHLPALPAAPGPTSLAPDPDDSWTINSAVPAREILGGDTICHLPGGTQIIWKAHPPARCQQDAALQFEVRDQAGQPAALQPYMGMMSHAAVLRSDGLVFSHLHPSGNYSMAAQMLFDSKIANEPSGAASPPPARMDQAKMDAWCGRPRDVGGASVISLPYQFPSPGDYRLWVQIKTDGRIQTAIFDTTVNPTSQPL